MSFGIGKALVHSSCPASRNSFLAIVGILWLQLCQLMAPRHLTAFLGPAIPTRLMGLKKSLIGLPQPHLAEYRSAAQTNRSNDDWSL